MRAVMNQSTKQKIVYGALIALTAWPAVHVGLAKAFDLSPWKLAGWGMYAAPRLGSLGMEVFYREKGDERMQQLTAPSAAERGAATVFLERHRWLRRLARPDRFAGMILDARPLVEHVQIVVFRPDMERDTAMIVMRRQEYDYDR